MCSIIEPSEFLSGEKHCGSFGVPNIMAAPKPLNGIMAGLTAYHVCSTAPYQYTNPGKPYTMDDFALLTARLSACAWRKYNGDIFLVTDKVGEMYIYDQGVEKDWSGVLPILDMYNSGINTRKFWASGKILALGELHAPFTIIDMDFIAWNPVDFGDSVLAVAHIEHLCYTTYPDSTFFILKKGYCFDLRWDFSVEPLNTALMYFADDNFKDYYVSESIRFMKSDRGTPDYGARCMVFAEQRILGMCSAAEGVKPMLLLDYDRLSEKQNGFTHIWGAKGLLRNNSAVREAYIKACVEKLKLMRG